VSVAYSYQVPDANHHLYFVADSVIEYAYVLFFSVLLLGLRWLAFRLQDPFGNYDEDLSIIHYVRFTVTASCRLLSESPIYETSAAEEEDLCLERGVDFGVTHIGDQEEEEEEDGAGVEVDMSRVAQKEKEEDDGCCSSNDNRLGDRQFLSFAMDSSRSQPEIDLAS
jgi:hypothetical protein